MAADDPTAPQPPDAEWLAEFKRQLAEGDFTIPLVTGRYLVATVEQLQAEVDRLIREVTRTAQERNLRQAEVDRLTADLADTTSQRDAAHAELLATGETAGFMFESATLLIRIDHGVDLPDIPDYTRVALMRARVAQPQEGT